ncbi:MAG TPA: LLM class flavin-dependent oxidoreductase [Kineosporiaceae bacterium]|nr:LLM class flavin-dependent oxidoreductase [Kineosporiaceae bacterium]
MDARRFRFGAVVAAEDGERWAATARRVAELGYATLLTPDGPQLLSPFAALAVAASVAPVRVGTFVAAAPLRPPRTVAWEAHSLTVLTGGRFEFGIGTGLPSAAEEARELGLSGGTGAQRLDQVVRAIGELRARDGELRTPVLVAAGGPRALAVAAEHADIVTFALGPLAGRDEFAAVVRQLRAYAGGRADQLELSANVFVVGDEIPARLQRFVGADLRALVEHGSLTLLRGTTQEMADELQRRRDELGTSYVTVNGAFLERFAPVVELLDGR